MKKAKHSSESKRRQRASRRKRKRQEKKLGKQSIGHVVDNLQRENQELHASLDLEKSVKEKYYNLWRKAEGEKTKLTTSRRVLSGTVFPRQAILTQRKELMQIDHSLLENYIRNDELGEGVFGRVVLKKFRGTPVAVKYFKESTSAKMVEREAQFLDQCSHINLPVIFGMNNVTLPYFIVTQVYGNEQFSPVTLDGIMKGSDDSSIFEPEQWLHIVSQLVEAVSYIHMIDILHNDIKSDNVLLTQNDGLNTPILIDFGKACKLSEGKRKKLTEEEQKKFREKHSHIAPEVVNGLQPQSVKSDVFSIGVLVAQVYKLRCKIKTLKELARNCLREYETRCNSSELVQMVERFKEL